MDLDKKEVLKHIGSRVESIRQEKGISYQELSYACNVDKSNLIKFMQGKKNVTLFTFIRIAKALDIDFYSLFE